MSFVSGNDVNVWPYLSCSSLADIERVLRWFVKITDDEVVSGADAETLLDTTQTRNLLIDELLEVLHTLLHFV